MTNIKTNPRCQTAAILEMVFPLYLSSIFSD